MWIILILKWNNNNELENNCFINKILNCNKAKINKIITDMIANY